MLNFFKRGKVEGSEDIAQDITPAQDLDKSSGDFQFVIEDVFSITGRGTVVTGRVISGSVMIGEEVKISNGIVTRVEGIEMFRKTLDRAVAGDNAGLLLHDVDRSELKRDMIITK